MDAKNLKNMNFLDGMSSSSTEVLKSLHIDDGEMKYQFDKDTLYLSKVSISDFVMSGNISGADYKCTMNYDVDISKFNDVDEIDYSIPEDVIKQASGGSTGGDVLPPATEGTTKATAPSTQTPSTEAKTPASSSGDKFGSIRGVPLTTGPNIFGGTFEPDGFYFDKSQDGKYMFSVCKNDKYEGLTLYLFHKDTNASNCTAEEIEKDGFYGYQINALNADGRPEMFWNGVSWGDSFEKIEKAYGKPDDTYDCDMYTQYTYKFANNIQMNFSVFKQGQKATGLQEVILYVFNYD